MLTEELKYAIKLSLIPGIGHVAAKKLIAYCGGVQAIFKDKKSTLLKIPNIGEKTVNQIFSSDYTQSVEEELAFIASNNIQVHFYLEGSYPKRLTHCEDAPILLYSKGNMDLNAEKTIAIVGTRNATLKGRKNCEQLIEELAAFQPTIVSGLAYGIDINAHKAALKSQLQTIAVLASGLDMIYPKAHYNIAQQMQEKGGLISDYKSRTKILPTNFVERNRIVAGMVDAVVVIESSEKGGSLITAEMANGYNRDVFALPGRIGDAQSVGCNRLIKNHKAALVESAADVAYLLGWEKEQPKKRLQTSLFHELSERERLLVELLKQRESKTIDELSLDSKMPMSMATAELLNLELKGIIISLPGKKYQLL